MTFFENMRRWGPLLSVVVVGGMAASSLSGYELPHYELEAQAAVLENDRPVPEQQQEETVIGAGNWELEDGVYRGKGVGYAGEIVVDVTISDRTITDIEIVSSQDDAAYLNRAKGVIDSILSAQTLDVDTVSGATYSSNGIIRAVKNALTGEEDTSSVQQTNAGKTAPSLETAEDPAAYRDGEYYGKGTGFGGEMTVKVVITGGKIASIDVVSHNDDDSFFNRASVLLSQIVERQSTNVDVVSGATYSSAGLINAVRDALRQAAADTGTAEQPEMVQTNRQGTQQQNTQKPQEPERVEEPSGYKDGVYYGTGTGFGGDIELKVTVSGGKIVSVEVVSTEDDEAFFSKAAVLLDRIVEQQSTNVDTVSGATYSSAGIIQAARDALSKAGIADGTEKESGTQPEVPDDGQKTEPDETLPETKPEEQPEVQPEEEEKSVSRKYENGSYSGRAFCADPGEEALFSYELGLTITIEDDRITGISNVTENGTDYTAGTENDVFIRKALEGTKKKTGLLAQILSGDISAGSVSVDAVTGATYSSQAIQNAVSDALGKAEINGDES